MYMKYRTVVSKYIDCHDDVVYWNFLSVYQSDEWINLFTWVSRRHVCVYNTYQYCAVYIFICIITINGIPNAPIFVSIAWDNILFFCVYIVLSYVYLYLFGYIYNILHEKGQFPIQKQKCFVHMDSSICQTSTTFGLFK